jgi:hypothetical protein
MDQDQTSNPGPGETKHTPEPSDDKARFMAAPDGSDAPSGGEPYQNDRTAEAPAQAGPPDTQGEADRIRAERYQRYLRDLRAHEENRVPQEAAAPPAQPEQRAPQPAPPPAPRPPAAKLPPVTEPPVPATPVADNELSDRDVDETIERYLQQSQQDQTLQYAGNAGNTDLFERPDDLQQPVHDQPAGQNPEDEWRDDIADEYNERGGLYTTTATAAQAKPRRRGRGFVLFGLLLGLLIVGGGLAYAYQQGYLESYFPTTAKKTVPVVQAENKPAKLPPKAAPKPKVPRQTKLIYDRIVGNEVIVKEKIVPREEQVAKPPPEPKPIPPQGPVATAPPSGPVANPETPPVPPAPPGVRIQQQPTTPPAPSVPPPPTPSTQRVVTPSDGPGASPAPDLPKVVITPPGTTPPTVTPPQPSTTRAFVQPAPPPTPRLKPQIPKPVVTQAPPSAPPNQPIRLTPVPGPPPSVAPRTPQAPRRVASAPPPARAARTATPGTGDYVVQVAAYRSQGEAAGALQRLKQKHATLLKNHPSFIQRADIPNKGTYFRLRLGPITGRAKAADLCTALKSAGERGCNVLRR